MTPLYIEHFGTTFQAARLHGDRPAKSKPSEALNERLASAAGIRPGQRVLDAGCGVCGPGLDIARAIDGVTIDAVTISEVQARLADDLIRGAGLVDRIQVCLADFHELPFGPGVFDSVVFLESVCYTYDLLRLLRGVCQVLRAGGSLYVKDGFKREGSTSLEEEQACARMCDLYAVPRPITVSEFAIALAFSGFVDIRAEPLDREMSFAPTYEAFFATVGGARVLNTFGARHNLPYDMLPLRCWQFRARRP